MKHSLGHIQKGKILEDIVSALNRCKEIILDYVFGSFVPSDTFSDIDLAILTDGKLAAPLDFELNLEIELEDILAAHEFAADYLADEEIAFG